MSAGHRDDPETGAFPGERTFPSTPPVRYLLDPGPVGARALLVGFSGAPRPNQPPRYHSHKITGGLSWHRLFLLDDQGPVERPGSSWYLGRHPGHAFRDAVDALIERTIREFDVKRSHVVTLGSSMGGWAALYFGARLSLGHAVAGEPQTRLGHYLCNSWFRDLAEHLAGGLGEPQQRRLDALLPNALEACEALPRVSLFCGRDPEYRAHHVFPLLDDLARLGGRWDLELGDNPRHEDLWTCFPDYLAGRLPPLLGELVSPDAAGRSGPLRTPAPAPS